MVELLNCGSLLIWPTRDKQELLFDLGERKTWDEAQRREAVEHCAEWLSGWGIGPKKPSPSQSMSWAEIRAILGPFVQKISPTKRSIGVGKGTAFLAELIPSEPKTLSNNIKNWFDNKREAHCWLLCLARYIQQPLPEGFLYHRRSIARLNEALDVCYGHLQAEQMDTADAMLLVNYSALKSRASSRMSCSVF
jgi:hypothetical protein